VGAKSKVKPQPKKTKSRNVTPYIYTEEWLAKEATLLLEWVSFPENFYFKRFALERGYTSQRFPEFAKRSEVFKEALALAKEWQEVKLVEGCIHQDFNSTMTKFVLQNCHGWQEKTQVTGIENKPFYSIMNEIDGKSKELVSD
jgi:hypothetical protein